MQLSDPDLVRDKCLVDGKWVGATSGESFPITNPATGAVISTVPKFGSDETAKAIAAAERAYPAWRAKTAKERAQLLHKWFDLIIDATEDLAQLMTAEQGKPLAEARGEVVYGASFVEWFSEEAKRIYGDTIPAPANDRKIVITKEPVGVVAAITPWNFPIAMITRKCSPAIAVGCTVVIKPAEDTPLCALALGELANRAGIPAGVINIITGDPVKIGGELTSNPIVRKLSFTGSTAVGKLLLSQCSATVKKVSMELGGNAPFIVFDDGDIDAAVAGVMASKYRNTGQTCVCANRIFVQSGVYDEFAKKLAEAVGELIVGDGANDGVTQGPLINMAAIEKVERLVKDATDKGARIITGGTRHELGGTYYTPTVLADVTGDMACSTEEIFGPVAPLYKFENEDEAVEMANATQYGLAAYFYSRDIGRVWRVADALEYGIVGINEGIISTEVAPFGGMKESGVGREGSKYGCDEYLETKYLCMGGLN